MKVLGIDPGLNKTGWGLVSYTNYKPSFLDCGVIKTDADEPLELRLMRIFDTLTNIIAERAPCFIAMEKVFINTNPVSSEKLIMARTASFISASKCGFHVFTYAPNEVKKTVTGQGKAKKHIVNSFVQQILGTKLVPSQDLTDDSIDALAIAICHCFSHNKRLAVV